MSKIEAINEMERDVGAYLTALEGAGVSVSQIQELNGIFANFLGAVNDSLLLDEFLTRQISQTVFDELNLIQPSSLDLEDNVEGLLNDIITDAITSARKATMPPPPPPFASMGGGGSPARGGSTAGGRAPIVNDQDALDLIQRYNNEFQITATQAEVRENENIMAAKGAIEHVNGFLGYDQIDGLANRRINFIKESDQLLCNFEGKQAEYAGYEFKRVIPVTSGLSEDERLDKMQGTLRHFYLEQEQYIASQGLTLRDVNIDTFYNNLETVLNIAHPKINLVDFLVDIGNQKSELKCFGPLLHNAVLDTSCPVGDHYLNGDNLGKVIDYYCSKGAKNELNTVFEHPNFKSLVQNSTSQRAVFQALKSSITSGKLTKLLGDDCSEIIKKATDDLPPKDQNKLLTQIDRSQSRLPEATAVPAWGSQSVKQVPEDVSIPKEDQFSPLLANNSSKASDEKAPKSQTTNVVTAVTVIASAILIGIAAVTGGGALIAAAVLTPIVGGLATSLSYQNDKTEFQAEQLNKATNVVKSAYQDLQHPAERRSGTSHAADVKNGRENRQSITGRGG